MKKETTPKREVPVNKPKEKPATVLYAKTFNDFGTGLRELYNINDDIKALFDEVNIAEKEFDDPDSAREVVLSIFTTHNPSFNQRCNLHYEVKLAANRVYLKTDKFFTFSWAIRSHRQEDNTYTYSYDFSILLIGDRIKTFEGALIVADWRKQLLPNYNKQ